MSTRRGFVFGGSRQGNRARRRTKRGLAQPQRPPLRCGRSSQRVVIQWRWSCVFREEAAGGCA